MFCLLMPGSPAYLQNQVLSAPLELHGLYWAGAILQGKSGAIIHERRKSACQSGGGQPCGPCPALCVQQAGEVEAGRVGFAR